MGVWGLVAFKTKKNKYSYASQWYIIGSLLWFPWILAIGQFFLNWYPLRGIMQSIVHTWYVSNIFYLWLCPMALAMCYYLIPKLTNSTIQSYHLSSLALWTFVIFSSWASLTPLIGGPIPVWLTTTSIVFSISLLLPIFIYSKSLIGTCLCNIKKFNSKMPLKFIAFGSVLFITAILVKILLSIRSFDIISHFSLINIGLEWHIIYGFFSMVIFGSFYYLLPILLKNSWDTNFYIKANFYSSVIGVTLLLISLYVGGYISKAAYSLKMMYLS